VGLQKELVIDLVIFLGSPRDSEALGPLLWSALEEVMTYMAPVGDQWLQVPLPTRSRSVAMVRPEYRRWYLGEDPPTFDLGHGHERDPHLQLRGDQSDELWGKALQRRSRFGAQALGTGVAALLGEEHGIYGDFVVVVTDRELVPPPDWRYVLWDGFPGGAVISVAPMDPRYWGAAMSDSALARRSTVKQGARAAVMSVVGSKIGLSRCENPQCFMFAVVDSVSRLAEMRYLGPEHSVTGLARGVFPVPEIGPGLVTTPQGETTR
jgi:hypothetical protein